MTDYAPPYGCPGWIRTTSKGIKNPYAAITSPDSLDGDGPKILRLKFSRDSAGLRRVARDPKDRRAAAAHRRAQATGRLQPPPRRADLRMKPHRRRRQIVLERPRHGSTVTGLHRKADIIEYFGAVRQGGIARLENFRRGAEYARVGQDEMESDEWRVTSDEWARAQARAMGRGSFIARIRR